LIGDCRSEGRNYQRSRGLHTPVRPQYKRESECKLPEFALLLIAGPIAPNHIKRSGLDPQLEYYITIHSFSLSE